jgi:putative ABC transport system permease protein
MGAVVARSVVPDHTASAEIQMDRYLTARFRTVWVDPTAEDAETYTDQFWTQVASNNLELKRALQAEPNIRAVAMGAQLPGMGHPSRPIEVEGDESESGAGRGRFASARVDVDIFRDLNHDVVSGRDFTSADLPAERGAHRPAVIVNTAFAEQVFGGGGVLGERIRYSVADDAEPGQWYEIVGVVEGLGMNVGNPEKSAGIYHPLGADEFHPMRYIIEVGEDPGGFVPRLRTVAAGIDSDAMIQAPMTLLERSEQNRLEDIVISLLVMMMSVVGTVLAAAGLYALMSFTVSQRTREIGIRTALGAQAISVVGTIARRAALQLGAGVVLGSIFGAWLLRQIVGDMDILSVNIPLVLLGVGTSVIILVSVACLSPILRGLRIQPTEALRDS